MRIYEARLIEIVLPVLMMGLAVFLIVNPDSSFYDRIYGFYLILGATVQEYFMLSKEITLKERAAGLVVVWFNMITAFYAWPLLFAYMVIPKDNFKIIIRKLCVLLFILMGVGIFIEIILSM